MYINNSGVSVNEYIFEIYCRWSVAAALVAIVPLKVQI